MGLPSSEVRRCKPMSGKDGWLRGGNRQGSAAGRSYSAQQGAVNRGPVSPSRRKRWCGAARERQEQVMRWVGDGNTDGDRAGLTKSRKDDGTPPRLLKAKIWMR